MQDETQEDALHRLARRHIAKVLFDLEEIGTPQITKDAVKKHFYFFEKDVASQVLSIEKTK